MCYIAYIKKSLRGRSMFDVAQYRLFYKDEAREQKCLTHLTKIMDDFVNILKPLYTTDIQDVKRAQQAPIKKIIETIKSPARHFSEYRLNTPLTSSNRPAAAGG